MGTVGRRGLEKVEDDGQLRGMTACERQDAAMGAVLAAAVAVTGRVKHRCPASGRGR